MSLFKKKKEELPCSFIFGDHKITVFRTWDKVPFSVYLKFLHAETTEDKLMLLTTATREALQDPFIRKSMENMTMFSVAPPQPTDELSFILDETFYSFDKDIELLKHTWDQFAYADKKIKPVYDLISDVQKENAKDEPDALVIAELTKKHSCSVIATYPNIISSYCNVAHDQHFDYDKVEKYYLPLVMELKTTSVMTLGAFFLTSLTKLKAGK